MNTKDIPSGWWLNVTTIMARFQDYLDCRDNAERKSKLDNRERIKRL